MTKPWEPDETPLRQIQTITVLYKLWYAFQELLAGAVAANPPRGMRGEPYLMLYVTGAGGVCYEDEDQSITFLAQWETLVEGVAELKQRVREHSEAARKYELEAVRAKTRAVEESQREPVVAEAVAAGAGEESDAQG